ncbi:MAG TPA: von Willebrand factor type A domain-containing protein [Kofleriaceae bacterium]
MRRANAVKLVELFLIAVVVLLVRVVSSHAESLGTIEGTIQSANGAALSGAHVAVTGKGVNRMTTADGSGHFSISGLPDGSYKVIAAHTGYTSAATTVTVKAGAKMSIKLSLAAKPVDKEKDAKKPAEKTEKPKPEAKRDSNYPSAPPPPVMVAPSPIAGGAVAPARRRVHNGPLTMEQDPSMNTEAYSRIDDNPFLRVADKPLSTFSSDVDTASYANLRRFVRDGALPPKDAVRIEEMINYFRYEYPAPAKGQPFSITTEVGPSPFNTKFQLVRIGLQAPEINDDKVPARNLVFLLDVSGSMMAANKLPLVKRAMNLLVENLRDNDRVAIAVYAGASGLALPSTSGKDKDTIRQAIANLEAGGSTNGAAGIKLAYDVAQKHFIKGGINRVILATDGDFNVGTTSEGDLTRLIEDKREHGVFLSVLGFGMGNLKDSTMEKLADRGNGNYAYIDSIEEARKVLVKEAGATLVTVAKDVKLQIEFNPANVAGYRLIGYENRLLRDEDFNDDKKDAGEIGAGHSVTALYEIVPAGVEVPGGKVDQLKYQTKAQATGGNVTELMTVKVRYKAPDGKTSKLLSQPINKDAKELAKTSNDFRWAAAVAGFGMMLREAKDRGNLSWAQVTSLAEGAKGADAEGYRRQMIELVKRAARLPKS